MLVEVGSSRRSKVIDRHFAKERKRNWKKWIRKGERKMKIKKDIYLLRRLFIGIYGSIFLNEKLIKYKIWKFVKKAPFLMGEFISKKEIENGGGV